ncbi:MAG: hypothetical protein JWN88_2199, partial [Frankiales bacterium]|nr:hypothetical protein [Frankiales bacterium]
TLELLGPVLFADLAGTPTGGSSRDAPGDGPTSKLGGVPL